MLSCCCDLFKYFDTFMLSLNFLLLTKSYKTGFNTMLFILVVQNSVLY